MASGLRDELPDIAGLADRWARDVLHCPYCHGYEVRDQRLAVLGSTPDAVKYTQIVRQWSNDVVQATLTVGPAPNRFAVQSAVDTSELRSLADSGPSIA